MKKKLLAFDLSSWMWTNLSGGTDGEHGYTVKHEDKEVYVNSAIYGYDKCLTRMLDLMKAQNVVPIDCILVFEGLNSKAKRLLINKEYKASKTTRPPEAYAEFEKLREMLKTTFKDLGAQVMWQDYAEGDDTLAWLAKNTEEHLVIATFDNDLAALNGINAFGAEVEVWVNGLLGVNKYGVFDYPLINTYKALVGDGSDNIKGCVGFGPAAFEKFCQQYGYDGLQELHDLLLKSDLSPLASMVDTHPMIKKIVDQAPGVMNSFDLARLRPEWVNTMAHPLSWEPGMVRQLRAGDDPRLNKWYGRSRLVTAANYEQAVAWAAPLIAASAEVALDIETSSADESDAWLASKDKPDGVDVLGSSLTGCGVTFGRNNQYSLYFSVDHANTDNCTSEQVRQFVASIKKPLVIQNVSFELSVLHREWADKQLDNGFFGFLPNVLDTKLEANYTDENVSTGLKQRSLSTLGYTQTSYDETTKLTAHPSELPKGGRLVSEQYKRHLVGTGKFEPVQSGVNDDGLPVYEDGPEIMKDELILVGHSVFEDSGKVDKKTKLLIMTEVMEPIVDTQTRRYKMNELDAAHVVGYGLDDCICTLGLHNYYRLFMQLEHTWQVYLKVEIDAAYANADAFISGIPFSMERMMSCEKEDKESVDKAWPVLRQFLMDHGWAGTVPPVYTAEISAAEVKDAFEIVTGRRMDTAMRTISKMVIFAREVEGEPQFAGMLQGLLDGQVAEFNKYVCSYFKGEPNFNSDSPLQMKKLLYETLGLPVRLSNKVTDAQRAKGERTGTPKTDDLAVQTALHFDGETTDLSVLKAIQTLKQCGTRSKLYYKPYRYFPHWLDGRLHPSTNQCATVTRRNSMSDPNATQWPAKGDGIKFRECIVPRGPGRVILSSDCAGQELRLAADWSRDPNMLSCYIGDNKRDIHSMVASAATRFFWDREWSYEEFYAALKGDNEHLAEKADAHRSKSKAVVFGEIYGSQAQSISHRLMISEEDAESFLEAKKAQFPGVDVWKDSVVAEARKTGYSLTMMGARRHLGKALMSGDKWEISKSERQFSNFCIQSSGAEAIKIALGKCFFSEVMRRCDVHILCSIHDEIVLDVPEEHVFEVARELVKFMEALYANMLVPFVSETTVGLDFGYQVKLPYGFDQAQVTSTLLKMHEAANQRALQVKSL